MIELANVGPLLPGEKPLSLLVGDGYIGGYFIASMLFPAVAVTSADGGRSPELARFEQETELLRRFSGVAIAAALGVCWLVGHLLGSGDYPVAPTDHDLFGAIAMLGIGTLIATLLARLLAPAATRLSSAPSALDGELRFGDSLGQAWGIALVFLYVGVWIGAG